MKFFNNNNNNNHKKDASKNIKNINNTTTNTNHNLAVLLTRHHHHRSNSNAITTTTTTNTFNNNNKYNYNNNDTLFIGSTTAAVTTTTTTTKLKQLQQHQHRRRSNHTRLYKYSFIGLCCITLALHMFMYNEYYTTTYQNNNNNHDSMMIMMLMSTLVKTPNHIKNNHTNQHVNKYNHLKFYNQAIQHNDKDNEMIVHNVSLLYYDESVLSQMKGMTISHIVKVRQQQQQQQSNTNHNNNINEDNYNTTTGSNNHHNNSNNTSNNEIVRRVIVFYNGTDGIHTLIYKHWNSLFFCEIDIIRQQYHNNNLIVPLTIYISFSSMDLYHNSGYGTGNMIEIFYGFRLIAYMHPNVDVYIIDTDDIFITKNILLLPWLTGYIPSQYDTNTLFKSKNQTYDCHIVNAIAKYLSTDMQYDFRRMTIGLIGTIPSSSSYHYYSMSQLFALYQLNWTNDYYNDNNHEDQDESEKSINRYHSINNNNKMDHTIDDDTTTTTTTTDTTIGVDTTTIVDTTTTTTTVDDDTTNTTTTTETSVLSLLFQPPLIHMIHAIPNPLPNDIPMYRNLFVDQSTTTINDNINDNMNHYHSDNNDHNHNNNNINKDMVDDVTIHFRCGDIMDSKHTGMAFQRFRTYIQLIEETILVSNEQYDDDSLYNNNNTNTNDTNTNESSSKKIQVGIITQPYDDDDDNNNNNRPSSSSSSATQQQQQKQLLLRPFDNHNVVKDRCRIVVQSFVEYIYTKLPNIVYNVRVHNNIYETIALTYGRIVLTKQLVIIGISSFPTFAGIASFATYGTYIRIPTTTPGPNYWIYYYVNDIKTTLPNYHNTDGSNSNQQRKKNIIFYNDTDIISVSDMKELWETEGKGVSAVLEWFWG